MRDLSTYVEEPQTDPLSVANPVIKGLLADVEYLKAIVSSIVSITFRLISDLTDYLR
jgi:hypothetical protein